MQGVQIAQAAFAILDIGLDTIARFAGAAVALVALGELGLDELPRRAVDHFALEALHQLAEQRLFAMDQPRVEECGADRHVGAGELQGLVDGARGMPDLEAQVPEQIEHVLHHALAPGRLLVGQHEQQIDVGEWGEQAATVAAGGDDGHPLGSGRVGGAIDVADGVVVDEADELVLEGRQPLGAAPPLAVGVELPGCLGAGGAKELLEPLQHRRPRLLGGAALRLQEPHQLAADLAGIEVRCGAGDALVHRGPERGCGQWAEPGSRHS
jgi:hypothetical protein